MRQPRLLLVEFRSKDLFSQYRSETFPFLQGAALAEGLSARWLCLGFDPATQLDARLTLTLPEEDLTRLEDFIREYQPTHLVLNEHLDQHGEQRLQRCFPELVWRYAEVSDMKLAYGQLLDWLSLPAADDAGTLLLDKAQPVYSCDPVNPLGEQIEKPIQVICGPGCLYSRPVTKTSYFADLDLSDACGHVYGCSFCGPFERLRHPYRTPPLDLAVKQIEAIRKVAGEWRHPPKYLIDGAQVFTQIEVFFERILALDHPPSEFFFACRADELRRGADKLETVLPALASAGHIVHFANMGVENFSPAENERLNKNITIEDVRGVLELFDRWERMWPGTVVFDRHGGFGFILFTPWTTLHDLELNARALRELRLKNTEFCLTTRLLLIPNRPITLLAQRDGLTCDAFEDPVMANFCRAGCLTEWGQQEVPWRFRDLTVALIHTIMMRRVPEAVAGVDDPYTGPIETAVRSLPPGLHEWLPFFEKLIEIARANPGAREIPDILRHLPRAPQAAPQTETEPEAQPSQPEPVVPTQIGLLRDRIEKILDWLAEHSRRPLRGFRGESVTAEGGRVRAELARRDDRLVIWIEPRGRVREAFRLTSQYAIYYAKETPVDTEDKSQVLSALAYMLERHGPSSATLRPFG